VPIVLRGLRIDGRAAAPFVPFPARSWSLYNEYFQWEPEYNYDSASHATKAGNTLFGSVTYTPANNSYTVYHSDLTTGWSVTSSIPVQEGKNYNILYFVMEKSQWRCSQVSATQAGKTGGPRRA